jgi:Bacterial Ig-like domain
MNTVARFLQVCCLLTLVACGGGGGDGGGSGAPTPPAPTPPPPSPPPPPASTYTVGGTVTGLQGSGLVLRNGGVDLPVAASGSFNFTAGLTTGTAFDVTVSTQPSQPTQLCTVTAGQGQVQSANVTSVLVECRVTFELLSTAPADEAQEVTRSIHPALTFSAPLDPASVVPGLVTLSSIGGDETVTVSATDAVLTIIPARALLPLTDYTLTVNNTLLSSSGATLPNPVQVDFRTREGAWGTQEMISGTDAITGGPFAVSPSLVVDADNRVTAIWQAGLQPASQIWARQRPEGGDWEAPVQIVDTGVDDIYSVAAGSGGSASVIVAWAQTENGFASDATAIYWRRYTPAAGWEPAQLVAQSTADHSSLSLAMRADGSGALTWYETTSNSNAIMASRFDPGSGWTPAQRIDTATGALAAAKVGVSDGGVVIAAWSQVLTGPGGDVFATRYDPANGWSAPEHLSAGFSLPGRSSLSSLAVAADGRAAVTWVQGLTVFPYISSSYYTPGQGWTAPERVENGAGSSSSAQVVIDHLGTAHAVWEQADSPNTYAHVSRRDPATGAWSAAQSISNSASSEGVFDPAIAIDRNGNVLAAWSLFDGGTFPLVTTVRSNRYTPANGWGGVETIGAPSGSAGAIQLVVDDAGSGWAIWSQRDSTNMSRVYVNRFE